MVQLGITDFFGLTLKKKLSFGTVNERGARIYDGAG